MKLRAPAKGFSAMLSFKTGWRPTDAASFSGQAVVVRWRNIGSGKFNLSRRNMTYEQRKRDAAARSPDLLLRISTGIEDGEDLIADTENGFRAANKIDKIRCDCAERGERSSAA